MNNYEYYSHRFYNCNALQYGTIHVNSSLSATSSEIKKAHELKCIIGEIGYINGSVVITMNASREPYENSSYILYNW